MSFILADVTSNFPSTILAPPISPELAVILPVLSTLKSEPSFIPSVPKYTPVLLVSVNEGIVWYMALSPIVNPPILPSLACMIPCMSAPLAVNIPSLVTSKESAMFKLPPVIVTELAVKSPSLVTKNTFSPFVILMAPELIVISPATVTVPAFNSLAIAALSATSIFATKVSNSNWVASRMPVHLILAVWSSVIWAVVNFAFFAWIKSAVTVFAISLLTVETSVYPTSFVKEDTSSPVWTEFPDNLSAFSPSSILVYLPDKTSYSVDTTLKSTSTFNCW